MNHSRSLLALATFALAAHCASTVQHASTDAAPSGASADVTSLGDHPADVVLGRDAGPSGDVLSARITVERGTVAVGVRHACAVDRGGAVWCWGSNTYGQLGDGTTDARPSPVRVADIRNARTLAVGEVSSCAVLSDGTVRCWGLDPTRSVDPRAIPRDALVLNPWTIANLDSVRHVSLGSVPSGSLYCAVRVDGGVWCWGNADLAPGYMFGPSVAAPTGPSALTDVESITISTPYRCATMRSGSVTCWGQRFWDPTFPTSPTVIEGAADALEVVIGSQHLCVLSRAGTVRCLGDNRYGGLGNGRAQPPDLRTFVTASGATGVVALSAGSGNFTVALRGDGAVLQWGTLAGMTLRTPTSVAGLSNIVDVSAGLTSACARRADGAVFCWGNNTDGQLGDGTLRGHADARRVVGLGP